MIKTKHLISGATAIIVLFFVIASPILFQPTYIQEQQEAPHSGNMTVLAALYADTNKITLPDVSYAFECEAKRAETKKTLETYSYIKSKIDTVTLPTEEIVLTSLGTYYITGYTSIECGGSTMTASGATVHKADYEDRLTMPTTCAIDPKLHDFGDLFYIAEFDTVYVAEDTGSAVKGKHLDLYFWDSEYNYALSITGYYEVFTVEYECGTVEAAKYNITELVWEVQNEQ